MAEEETSCFFFFFCAVFLRPRMPNGDWACVRGGGGKLAGLMEPPQGQPNCNYRP